VLRVEVPGQAEFLRCCWTSLSKGVLDTTWWGMHPHSRSVASAPVAGKYVICTKKPHCILNTNYYIFQSFNSYLAFDCSSSLFLIAFSAIAIPSLQKNFIGVKGITLQI
jgi:hypothetical protein